MDSREGSRRLFDFIEPRVRSTLLNALEEEGPQSTGPEDSEGRSNQLSWVEGEERRKSSARTKGWIVKRQHRA